MIHLNSVPHSLRLGLGVIVLLLSYWVQGFEIQESEPAACRGQVRQSRSSAGRKARWPNLKEWSGRIARQKNWLPGSQRRRDNRYVCQPTLWRAEKLGTWEDYALENFINSKFGTWNYLGGLRNEDDQAAVAVGLPDRVNQRGWRHSCVFPFTMKVYWDLRL